MHFSSKCVKDQVQKKSSGVSKGQYPLLFSTYIQYIYIGRGGRDENKKKKHGVSSPLEKKNTLRATSPFERKMLFFYFFRRNQNNRNKPLMELLLFLLGGGVVVSAAKSDPDLLWRLLRLLCSCSLMSCASLSLSSTTLLVS